MKISSTICSTGYKGIAHSLFLIAIFLWTLTAAPDARSEEFCGDVYNSGRVGPWDYTAPQNWSQEAVAGSGGRFKSRIQMVESVHFTKEVRTLSGSAKGTGLKGIQADLDYTLSVIPNHPEALLTLVRLAKRLDWDLYSIGKFRQSIECYFDRAFQFRPDDPNVWMVYGIYFHMRGEYREAIKKYQKSASLREQDDMGENPELLYNMGLSHFKLENYDKARSLADRAAEHGYPLRGLHNMLGRKGK